MLFVPCLETHETPTLGDVVLGTKMEYDGEKESGEGYFFPACHVSYGVFHSTFVLSSFPPFTLALVRIPSPVSLAHIFVFFLSMVCRM